jgi:hypothetical protein
MASAESSAVVVFAGAKAPFFMAAFDRGLKAPSPSAGGEFESQFEFVLDDVGDDFGVGFGEELVALGGEGGLELEVVFDDAVVHDDERAGAVAVGVGVFFGGAAVGGPAGVADAVGAVDGVAGEDLGEVAELAGSAAELERVG